MTDGEKLVWAAVFATKYDISNPPSWAVEPGKRTAWQEWEMGQMCSAIEAAGYAVEQMRESRVPVTEGWGGDSETFKMLREILD